MPMFDNMFGGKSVAQGAVIAVEPLSETIHFCTPTNDQRAMKTSSANYKPQAFDQEFYDQLAKIVKQQREKKPKMDLQKAAIVLPDQLFLLDMISIPMIHRKAMQSSLSLAVEAIYKNAEDLNLVTYAVQQNKQLATFGLAGARRDLLDQVRQTFADVGVTVTGITFASNAMVNGAFALNPKLKGETFLLMDIKENYSRFAFVVRGCTMGYYDLPFGREVLSNSRLAEEHMLFDHRAGELLVLNAKERARAKQLTMEGELPGEQAGEEAMSKGKSSRKLPKFMQRPVPQSQEEYLYENFRIFIKWALDLIGNNRDIVSLDKLGTVYVNMPAEYHFLFDVINKKRESHGVTFAPLLTDGNGAVAARNLELYGGFFLGQYNEANTF